MRRQGGGRIIQISSSVGQAAYPTLGGDAYALIHENLTGRLAALEAQKELAHSTHMDA